MYKYPEGCCFDTLEAIKNKKVTIMGLGLNGGGVESAKWFLAQGAFVTVTDLKNEGDLGPSVDELNSFLSKANIDKNRLVLHLGFHKTEDFTQTDCVIKNPIVNAQTNEYIQAALTAGVPIETDLSVFLHFNRSPIIAVTGTKGKSTTAAAIKAGFDALGKKAFLGGNITMSPLSFLSEAKEDCVVILELSSWQLRDLFGREVLKPKVAVITKIASDHQNWYHSMENYVGDKALIYSSMNACDTVLLDSDEWGDKFFAECEKKGIKTLRYNGKDIYYKTNATNQALTGDDFTGFLSGEVILKNPHVVGLHTKQNLLNAAAVLRIWGFSATDVIMAMGNWEGVAHRLQFFYQYKTPTGAIYFYNDSAATIPEAAEASVAAFSKNLYLITGGTDKGLDFTPLSRAILNGFEGGVLKGVYFLAGTGTDKLFTHFERTKLTGGENSTLQSKVYAALDLSKKQVYQSLENLLLALKDTLKNSKHESGDATVLFSPGCTSFGMFSNEFDRGNKFMEETKKVFCQELHSDKYPAQGAIRK